MRPGGELVHAVQRVRGVARDALLVHLLDALEVLLTEKCRTTTDQIEWDWRRASDLD